MMSQKRYVNSNMDILIYILHYIYKNRYNLSGILICIVKYLYSGMSLCSSKIHINPIICHNSSGFSSEQLKKIEQGLVVRGEN